MFGFIKRFFGTTATAAPTVTAASIVIAALSSSKYEFRSRTALARKLVAAGFSAATATNELDGILATIGTRAMPGNSEMVGLISRIGSRPRRWSQLG